MHMGTELCIARSGIVNRSFQCAKNNILVGEMQLCEKTTHGTN